jgi:hypothetical protein
LYKKYYLKPKEVKKIEISEMNKERFVSKLKERPPEVFNEEYSDLINTEERYTDVKKSPFYPGAMGELEVLAELTKLDNNYNILCGLNITLPEWHSYNGKSYNLKSAQMDLVVICRKGIFVIEVKNWSTNFYNEYRNISPYEQVSRAGRVLYLSLNRQKHLSRKLGVTTVLISIRNNMPYNSDYTHVMVLRKENITVFIKNRTDSLSQYEVDEVVDELKRYATYNQNSG